MSQVRRTAPKLLLWVGFGLLLALVGSLVFVALNSGATDADGRPSSELTLPPIEVETTPPEPPAPAVTPAKGLLSLIEDEVFWRTSGGECVPGDESADGAVIERALDASEWADVTPANFDIREVVFLWAINEAAAEAVVLLGDDCDAQVIRTFTSGNFWEPYDESIRGAVYVAADRAVIVAPDAEAMAPCEAPLQNLSGQANALVAIVCESALAWWNGSEWELSEQPGLLSAALDSENGIVVTASIEQPGCDGTMLRRWSGAESMEAEICVGVTGATAVYATSSAVWVWHAGGVEALATP